MSLRKLLAMLLAMAVLFAPTLARAGEAYAAAPGHEIQMMEAGHCTSPADEERSDSASKKCCTTICMAVAVAPIIPVELELVLGNPAVSGLKSFEIGHPAEIATPPPRAA